MLPQFSFPDSVLNVLTTLWFCSPWTKCFPFFNKNRKVCPELEKLNSAILTLDLALQRSISAFLKKVLFCCK